MELFAAIVITVLMFGGIIWLMEQPTTFRNNKKGS